MGRLRIFSNVPMLILFFALSGRGIELEQLAAERVHTGPVEKIIFTFGGFLSLDRNNESKVIHTNKEGITPFRILHTIQGDSSVGYLALAGGGFLTQASPGMMHIWSCGVPNSTVQCNGKIRRVLLNKDGRKIAVILDNGALMPWFPNSRAFISERFFPTIKYVDATFSYDDSIIAATDQNTFVTLSKTFEPMGVAIKPDRGTLLSLDYDHKQKRLLVTTSLGVYAYDQQGIQTKVFTPSSSKRTLEKTIFSPNKEFFWIKLNGSDRYGVRNSITGDVICLGNGSSDYHWSLRGKYLFAVLGGRTVNIRTAPDFDLRQYFFDSTDITTATLGDDSEHDGLLATGHSDGSIRIYRLARPVPTSTPSKKPKKIILIVGTSNAEEISEEELKSILQSQNSQMKLISSL